MSTVVYVRVSSEDQAERGTIENQIEFANKYCDLHQLGHIEFYKDDGVTGTISLEEREVGKRLMNDAREGKFNSVLIYKLDRLGRSARIILNAVYELEGLGIKIKSMTEPFDTGDPSGRFLLTILAGVADLERETILERLNSGANRAARMGKWLGGIVPYGYLKNKEKYLEVSNDLLPGFDLSESDVIKLMYRLIVEEKMSSIKIADYLNALGVPTSYAKDSRKVTKGKRKENTSGLWQPSRVGNTIKNTIYKGIHGYGKRSTKEREVIYRSMPLIVSEDVWEQAQVILKSNKIMSRKNSKHKYLLRGLIKCADCNLTYIGTYYKSFKGKLMGYYVCNGKHSYRGKYSGKCKSINVAQEWVENLVWNDIEMYISNPNLLLVKPIKPVNHESEKKIIIRTIEQKEVEKQSILDLYRKKIISIQDVEIQIDKMANEIISLQGRIREIDSMAKDESFLKSQHSTAIEMLTSLQGKIKNITWEQKREIVELLVKKITVDREKENPKNVDLSIEYYFLSC